MQSRDDFLFPTTPRNPKLTRNKEHERRSARTNPYIQGLSVGRLHVETRCPFPTVQVPMHGWKAEKTCMSMDKQTLPAICIVGRDVIGPTCS
jgi:hypothetical protein